MSDLRVNSSGTVEAPKARPQTHSNALAAALLRQREFSVVLVVCALAVYFGISNAAFYTMDNIGNLANITAAPAIVAAGEVMLLVSGEIDLSVGMTFALTPFVMMWLNDQGMPLFPALICSLLVAAFIGLANGLLTILLKLPSFITTLGMLYLLQGATLKLSNSYPRAAPEHGLLTNILGGWEWSEILWALAIVLVMQIVLTSTRWGAHTIATGGNSIAAAEAGINVQLIKVRAFVATAVFGGFAGVLEGIHVSQTFDPNAGGSAMMFAAVASAVIGGTALLGGSGTIIGALFGALLLAILQNGFNLQGVSATTFILVEGIAILLAMGLNTMFSRFRQGPKGG